MKAFRLPGVNENSNLRSFYIDRKYCAQGKVKENFEGKLNYCAKTYNLLFELKKRREIKYLESKIMFNPNLCVIFFVNLDLKSGLSMRKLFKWIVFVVFLVCSVIWKYLEKGIPNKKKGYFQKQSETKKWI